MIQINKSICNTPHPERPELLCEQVGLHVRHCASTNDPQTGWATMTYWPRLDIVRPEEPKPEGTKMAEDIELIDATAPNTKTSTPADELKGRITTAPYQPHSPESRAAAKDIEAVLNALQQQVYDLLWEHPEPLTDQAIMEMLAMEENTSRPRRVELTQMGLVERKGTGTTRSGKDAALWGPVGRVYPDPEPIAAGGLRNFD